MASSTTPDPAPLGVPLDDLEAAFAKLKLSPTRRGNRLAMRHGDLAITLRVDAPAAPEGRNGRLQAVVSIRTEMPAEIAAIVARPDRVAAVNPMASLAALTVDEDGGGPYIGSRLTTYEAHDAWKIYFPMVLFAVILGADSLLLPIGKIDAAGNMPMRKGESAWTEEDLALVESRLSRFFVCTTGGLELTAEFPLAPGATSAMTGSNDTALWQLSGDEAHLELGGGLLCLLQMPHQYPDEATLHRVLARLNRLEMAGADLPPHFGAWCPGRLQNNPAYVTFLPNALHEAHGVAVNAAFWAASRARWAEGILAASE